MSDPRLSDLLALARDIWGDHTADAREIVTVSAVITGDLARIARDGGSRMDVKRELGNLILSAVRWADDREIPLTECIAAAEAAQRAYVARGDR